MIYSILLSCSAAKELDNLDPRQRERVVDHLRQLETEPRPLGARKLTGRVEYRIRTGDLRIVYDVDDKLKQVTVLVVADRKDVYRKLQRR